MTTQPDAVPEDSLTGAVAGRLRGWLAERRIRQTEVMLATGWSKATASRKMHGKSAIDTEEFDKLWAAFGISPVFLITGQVDGPPPSVPPAGFEPAAFRSEDPQLATLLSAQPLADVLQFPCSKAQTAHEQVTISTDQTETAGGILAPLFKITR